MVKNFILVFITTSGREEAEKIAMHLINSGSAPCINILTSCVSVYQWKGEVRTDQEALMIVKSSPDKFQSICETVNQLHSYDVPEVISVRLDDLSRSYGSYLEGFLR